MKMSQALAKNGNDVWLCLLNDRKENKQFNVKESYSFYDVDDCFRIVNVPVLADNRSKVRFLLSHIASIPSLARLFRRIKPDLVYGRHIFSCYVAACMGIDVIVESHFPVWHGKIAAFAFRRLVTKKECKNIVVITEALRRAYLDHYNDLKEDHIIVAPDGADPAADIQAANKLIFGRPGVLQVGYVGHLYKGKGVEVIEAIAPEMPDVDFHIIGGLEEDIQSWKKKINLPHVYFHGFVTQEKLPQYIRALDICLLPNQTEVLAYGSDSTKKVKNISTYTSPLKMFEYMSYAKPIVASDLPVLREVLNEEIAVMVRPDNYDGWIEAINRLRDDKMRKKMGNEVRKLFLHKYTWEKRASSVLADSFARCETK